MKSEILTDADWARRYLAGHAGPRLTWEIRALDLVGGDFVETVKATIRTDWPTPEFCEYAESHGYRKFRCDSTLIGGYFVNPDGAGLVCCPRGQKWS